MAEARNYEEYRRQVLDELGIEYVTEDITDFRRWKKKLLNGLADLISKSDMTEPVAKWLDAHPEVVAKAYVTPAMFGAKGDGVTDDTEAISEACEFARLNNMPVLFKQNYAVSDRINIGSAINIVGINNASITQKATNCPIFYSESVTSVSIDGLTLIGLGSDYVNSNVTSKNAASGLYINGTTESANIRITNCVFKNFGFASLYFKYCKDVKISHCMFELLGSTQISAGGNYNFGIRAVDGIKNIEIDSNTFKYGAIHISIGSIIDSARIIENINISNNLFDTTYGQHAVYMQDGKNVCISSNCFSQIIYNSIKLQADNQSKDFSNITIVGNVIESTNDWGITLTYNNGNVHIKKCIISNNTLHGGINVENCDWVLVKCNNINWSNSVGIYVRYSNYCNIANNVIQLVNTIGIYVIGTNATHVVQNSVINNIIFNCGQNTSATEDYGLYFGYADYLFIAGNVVDCDDGNMSYGCFLLNSNSGITNCFMDNNKFLRADIYSLRFQANEQIENYSNNYTITKVNVPY